MDNDFYSCIWPLLLGVMTLAISHMKSEDEGVPIFFWSKLNSKYAEHGVKEVKFVRFMVDWTQGNWLVVWKVDNNEHMLDGQECTSSFYFEENF